MLNSGYKAFWYWNYDRWDPKDGKRKNIGTLEEALEYGDLEEIQEILACDFPTHFKFIYFISIFTLYKHVMIYRIVLTY